MKILIIESESYLAQSIANKLGALGHECTNAASLAAAAGIAEEFEAVLYELERRELLSADREI